MYCNNNVFNTITLLNIQHQWLSLFLLFVNNEYILIIVVIIPFILLIHMLPDNLLCCLDGNMIICQFNH